MGNDNSSNFMPHVNHDQLLPLRKREGSSAEGSGILRAKDETMRNPQECALRKVFEETGLKIANLNERHSRRALALFYLVPGNNH